MPPGSAPAKISWTPILALIAFGILIGASSFVALISQWGNPSSPVAAASFLGDPSRRSSPGGWLRLNAGKSSDGDVLAR